MTLVFALRQTGKHCPRLKRHRIYCGNNNITVKWKDGTETRVPSRAKRPWEIPKCETSKKYIPQVRGPKTVRKIKAEK